MSLRNASLVLARALWTRAQDPGLSQAKLPNVCASTNRRVSRPEPRREEGPTDWLGIGGLGWDLEMSGPFRTGAGLLTPLAVWTETLLTDTNADITASQASEGQWSLSDLVCTITKRAGGVILQLRRHKEVQPSRAFTVQQRSSSLRVQG
ncbi:hypothetical protein EYF80_029826 [Liparis tanakae]|uniref:Uncharacterized protein n=1 Tax=Liparis tanakae TaxID=230148 RepID=A0A4Z2H579_9TELE|nr:hypothetical protein EYF80_029826 [Liparis tanakae]